MFFSIFEIIKNKYKEIFFATIKNNNENNEYEVILEDAYHRYFLDFYVKDNNKVIEFDGDYWHGEKRGNQKRDKQREDNLRKLGFVNILRIKERDYKSNPDEVVKRCVDFINN